MKHALDCCAEKQNFAAGAHTVVKDTGMVHVDSGSHCMLGQTAEAGKAAAADTVALTGLAELAVVAVLSRGLVEIAEAAVSVDHAVVADNDALGIADLVDTAVQDSLVVAAEIEIAVLGTADSVDSVDIVGFADTVDSAGTVDFADNADFGEVAAGVDLVYIVENVDNAGFAVGTADIVAAIDWQPYLTATIPALPSTAGEDPRNVAQILKTSVGTKILE